MANPAPIISQINAFNATEGTIISFNIVGGTSIVRSNIIYIYDLSDNSLICTHLYISTESIHELPANTDPSIAYASGKSSADFTNGKQYYAQIQTFTNTAGTEGASGASIAKLFWCLVDPTLTINTIPSSISTTSYNVGAVYNSNTTATSNIVQQYQFNLYSATGVLVQSSGVITGSGAQQGTSTAYDLSYNFTGLNVGSSYYITVEATTTQGMTVSAQSNTFTVSIDTPTLGEATVVNNACDGYISVVSNLSDEYGGHVSGSIATFETTSVNEISSLEVTLDPIQDLHGYDHPWVGGAGKNKALVDATTIEKPSYWTSLWSVGGVYGDNGYIATRSNGQGGGGGFVLTNLTNEMCTLSFEAESGKCVDNYYHIYVHAYDGDGVRTNVVNKNESPSSGRYSTSFALPTGTVNACIRIVPNTWIDEVTQTAWINKIQLELGSTATSFAPYSNICPISGWDSVEASVAGKNLFSDKFEDYTLYEYFVAPIKLEQGATYKGTVKLKEGGTPQTGFTVGIVKCGKRYSDFVSGLYIMANTSTTLPNTTTRTIDATWTDPSIVIYTTPRTQEGFESFFENYEVQLEKSTTPTEFEPYQGETYTATFEETVYGATVDLVSGVLTVDRAYVDLGTLNWRYQSSWASWYTDYFADMKGTNTGTETPNFVSDRFEAIATNYGLTPQDFGGITSTVRGSLGCRILVRNGSTTEAPTGQLCYELAEPRTIQLDPQTINTLVGVNNVWADSGDVSVTYNIPITKLLVKRQDTADISGKWLTLYSQPITQASDMDFTFIDFLNQYGKTYKYALVPLLTQEQSGVEVEVEGGYTVSDEVVSIFDGVFVADNTAIYKLKAGVNYGDLSKVQEVGSINTIGSKYPIIVSNSKVDYRTASLSATIVADDYYNNGNLNRMDMVQKRELMESFFTNKRAKILKDWNGNIWLVVFIDNINITFTNEYGMGIATLTATWTEIGDVTSEEDLQNTRIINVG